MSFVCVRNGKGNIVKFVVQRTASRSFC